MALFEQPYTENFDTLVAVITYLSNITSESKPPSRIAKDLSLDEKKVKTVLERFPAFFRRGSTPNDQGEYHYTVHLRFSRRNWDREGVHTEPLKPEELSALFDLISKMIANENEMSRLHLDLTHRNRTLIWTNILTLIAALIAAAAAIAAAFLKG